MEALTTATSCSTRSCTCHVDVLYLLQLLTKSSSQILVQSQAVTNNLLKFLTSDWFAFHLSKRTEHRHVVG